MSADHRQWFVLNASPDIRAQIEAFPALQPHGGRASPLRAVLLTDAELDHTLGLLLLREGDALALHATPAALEVLDEGTALLRTLAAYCTVERHEVMLGHEVSLAPGLSYRAFDVPTDKPARFGVGGGSGRVVGYRLTDQATGRAAAYLPSVQELTTPVYEQLAGCACVLIDGTCWSDEELVDLKLAGTTARGMGHMPIGGPDGTLEQLSAMPAERKIYVHVNNTNPILLEDSTQRRLVEKAGLEVATDGLEVRI